MKRSELLFNLLSIPVDVISLVLAGIVSFYIRLSLEEYAQSIYNYVGPVTYELQLRDFLSVILWIVPVLICVFAILGLYNLKGTRRFISEFGSIAIGTSLGLLLVVVLFFFDQTIFPSRFIILATWLFATLFVLIGRYLLKNSTSIYVRTRVRFA